MKRSTCYGLVAIAALALLSGVHWVRDWHLQLEPFGKYLVGVTPNFAAAIAITFVPLSIWADHDRNTDFVSARRWLFIFAAISGSGLVGWELVQKTSHRFVFDLGDLVATFAGIAAAVLLFYLVTPRAAEDR